MVYKRDNIITKQFFYMNELQGKVWHVKQDATFCFKASTSNAQVLEL